MCYDKAGESGTTDWVFQGIFYFLTHPELWKPLRSRLLPYVALYSSVLGSMFFFTYLPQVAIMAFVNGPLAVFTTALLILNESSTITGIISKNYLLQDAILDTFDGTLVARNKSNIVAEGREVKARGDSIQRLGKALKTPFKRFSINELVRYVMYLPLNFIPGTYGHRKHADLLSRWTALTLMTQSWVPWRSSCYEARDSGTRMAETWD
jgi:hypothetical protein